MFLLNKKSWTPTEKVIEEYRKKMIFVVDKRFVTPHPEPHDNPHPIIVAKGVHIMTVGTVQVPKDGKVEFRYFSSEQPHRSVRGASEYEPIYIEISNGVKESDDWEVNYWLDNNVGNSKVCSDSAHIAHQLRKAPIFHTYSGDDLAAGKADIANSIAYLQQKIYTDAVESDLRALADGIVKSGRFRTVMGAHDTMPLSHLQGKLFDCVLENASMVWSLVKNNKMEIHSMLLEMVEKKIIIWDGAKQAWGERQAVNGQEDFFLPVTSGDTMEALVHWFDTRTNLDARTTRLKNAWKASK